MDAEFKEAMLARFGEISVKDILKQAFSEVDAAMAGYTASQKRTFEGRLTNRIDKAEKLAYIKAEIEPLRALLEKDIVSNALKVVSSTSVQEISKSFAFIDNAISLAHLMPKDQADYVTEHLPKLNNLFSSDTEIQGEDLKEIFRVMPDIEEYSPALMKVINSDDPLKQLASFLILIQYQNEHLEYLIALYNQLENDTPALAANEDSSLKKEFTTARQVLAIHYLMDELNVYPNTDKTEIARFIQFLTGKDTGSSKIRDTNIYKRLKSPLAKEDKRLDEDLKYIRNHFEKLGLQNIVNSINKEIGSKE